MKNKTTLTTGPWKNPGWRVDIGGNTITIAPPGITTAEADANAALIAAAPDLLAALEFCADALNTEAGGLYKAHIEQARAAIAKAKGESC